MKIYPNKVSLFIIISFTISNIVIFLLINSTSKEKAILTFLVFFIVTILLVQLGRLLYKITVNSDNIIITDNTKISKKIIIKFRDIQKLESKEIKFWTFKERIFIITIKPDNNDDKILIVNQGMYCNKDIDKLFKYVEGKYHIPYLRQM